MSFSHPLESRSGLKPKAPHYEGWESQGIAGHSLGHYLSACAQMYAATGERKLKERVGSIVAELKDCQSARKDGRLTAFPDADRIFGEISRGEIRSQGFDLNGSWVPWYTLHKLFAGLLADWAIGVTLDEALWQKMLSCEFGGMNESLARKFDHKAILAPRSVETAPINGGETWGRKR